MISSHFAALAISTGTKWLPETVFLETKRFSPGSPFLFLWSFLWHYKRHLWQSTHQRRYLCLGRRNVATTSTWTEMTAGLHRKEIFLLACRYTCTIYSIYCSPLWFRKQEKNKDASQVSLLKRFFTWEWNSKKWGPGDGIVPMKKCPRWESFPSSQLPTSSEGLKSRSGWPNPGYQPGWGG